MVFRENIGKIITCTKCKINCHHVFTQVLEPGLKTESQIHNGTDSYNSSIQCYVVFIPVFVIVQLVIWLSIWLVWVWNKSWIIGKPDHWQVMKSWLCYYINQTDHGPWLIHHVCHFIVSNLRSWVYHGIKAFTTNSKVYHGWKVVHFKATNNK